MSLGEKIYILQKKVIIKMNDLNFSEISLKMTINGAQQHIIFKLLLSKISNQVLLQKKPF